MENQPKQPNSDNGFHFADALILDDSSTRSFYKNLLQGLIHKNNNTLGVIQGFATLLSMEEGLNAEMIENIDHMRHAITQSSELAKIILTAGGCATVDNKSCDIAVMLPHLEQSCRTLCEQIGATLQINQAPNLPSVLSDTGRFNDVIRELVKNAAEACVGSEQADVVIDILAPGSVSPDDTQHVDIFIRNTCADIPADKLPQIFQPFYTTKDNSHQGIGLTTAGVLAGQMGMRLGLRSSEGTTTAWLSVQTAPTS
ncbi:MAG: HAMP domain-containing histidine kinase [Verrucomicrobiales bacterium]|nr:HAMP domain-containing histidine kinase [Verrucomicrobiales bacterium]